MAYYQAHVDPVEASVRYHHLAGQLCTGLRFHVHGLTIMEDQCDSVADDCTGLRVRSLQ